MSATKTLSQVVSYISPELRRQLDQDRQHSPHRLSMSAYIEHILSQHLARRTTNRRRTS